MRQQQDGQSIMSRFNNSIPISEIFYSLSGEGPDIGTPSVFIRVFGCCAKPPCPWCDSMYAVRNDNPFGNGYKNIWTAEEIIKKIKEYNCKDVTFTGGEPFLYINQIKTIIEQLGESYKFHFETNGMIVPEEMLYTNVTYSVSPKFHLLDLSETMNPNFDCNAYIGSLRHWVEFMHGQLCLKFVYEGEETIKNIKILESMVYGFRDCSVYLMPEGNQFDQKKYLECAEQCKKHNYKMSARLQNILWGPKRGV